MIEREVNVVLGSNRHKEELEMKYKYRKKKRRKGKGEEEGKRKKGERRGRRKKKRGWGGLVKFSLIKWGGNLPPVPPPMSRYSSQVFPFSAILDHPLSRQTRAKRTTSEGTVLRVHSLWPPDPPFCCWDFMVI